MSAIFWHLQLFAVGLVFGCCLVLSPHFLPFTRAGRLMAGMSLAPFLIAAITIVFAALFPRSPAPIFAFVPTAIATFVAMLLLWKTNGEVVWVTLRGVERAARGVVA